MNNDLVLYSEENGVAHITLNRPEKHNAFNAEIIELLTSAFKNADTDEKVQCILLNANGNHFSAGADLKWMKESARLSKNENIDDAKKLSDLMHTIFSTEKPTIGLIQGATYGGAVGIASALDVVFCDESARFCLSETKLGLIPAVVGPYVQFAIGSRQAKRFFLTAEEISADKAKEIGLVHEVYKKDELQQKTNELIATILKNGPTAMKSAKELVCKLHNKAIDENIKEMTIKTIADIRVGEEAQERLTAFLNKK